MFSRQSRHRLRAGGTIRVRSEADILATLDEHGRIDGQPFQPEMLRFVGQEMTIYKSAHKTCDTVAKTGNTLKMDHAWHLEGARCDGSAHGGCQQRCMHFWKEEWLEYADGTPVKAPETRRPSAVVVDRSTLDDDTQQASSTPDEPVYRCAATELLNSTTLVSPLSPTLYLADIRTGNASVRKVSFVVGMTLFNKYQSLSKRLPKFLRVKDGEPYPFAEGTNVGKSVGPANTGLQIGERVRVRPRHEIVPTLNADLKNRGLWFDPEMFGFCDKEGEVLDRVERIIDEGTGKMITLKDCVIIDGMTCDGWLHRLCPRSDYNYFRELWLDRVEPAATSTTSSTS